MESIKIGNQEWASVNLNIDHFNNGDKIQQIESSKDWLKCLDNKTPAWCYYDNNSSNGNIYGKLYNCYAVLDSRKIAPDGWHIPTDKEWDELIEFSGGSSKAGKLLKSSSGWTEEGNGINSHSFSALPGGYRTPSQAELKYSGEYGFWWSANQISEINKSVWGYCFYPSEEIDKSGYGPSCGLSIRCIRN